MTIIEMLFWYYMVATGYLYKMINWLKRLFMKVMSIKTITNNTIKSIYLRYIMVKLLSWLPYINKSRVMNYMDPSLSIVDVVIEDKSSRKIILENKNLRETMEIIKNETFDVNELIMTKKYIVTDIVLTNGDETVSIKKELDEYADNNKKYESHTVKNILLVKNIQIPDGAKIEVRYLQFINKRKKQIDDMNTHIADVYNI